MKKLIRLAVVVVVVLVMTAISVLPVGANGTLPEVTWLPPISNQEEFQLKDGSTLPIKFTLTDPGTGVFVEDTSVKVDVNKVLFRDDFNDGNADGWTPVNGDTSWSVVDGVLRCEQAIVYPRILVDDTLEYENYIFEADARLISGLGYALLFRATDHNNFYSFQYDPGAGNNLRLSQFDNFPYYTDVDDMIPYTIDDQWHHLKVAVWGNNIKCYVDGNLVFNVDDMVDPMLLEGGIGFRTWFPSMAEFDNVMVLSLPATETFNYGEGSDNIRISYDTMMSHYIANLHTKESAMTTGDYLITVWSGSGNQLSTYLFDLTDAIQGKGRGRGKEAK